MNPRAKFCPITRLSGYDERRGRLQSVSLRCREEKTLKTTSAVGHASPRVTTEVIILKTIERMKENFITAP